MRTERIDIRVYRNADYHETWQLNDTDNQPIDLTGCALALDVRPSAGQGAVVASASIFLYDPARGAFSVRLDGDAFAAVQGQSEVVRLTYDLRLTYQDGVRAIPAAGQILLTPGATL